LSTLQRFLPPKTMEDEKDRSKICLYLLAFVTFLLLVPFIGKAYHMDDPLFIWAAKQIQHSPANPYGIYVNWYGKGQALWDIAKNPPLTSYYLALFASVTGWGEIPIHVSMMVWAIAAMTGIYSLARYLGLPPIETSLIALMTPVFLVSSTTVMCDVMMLSFWIWAIVLWMKGIDDKNRRYLVVSMLLAAAASLTKYFGIALIPMLFAYSLVVKRRLGWWVFYFIIPAVILAGYQWATIALYGQGLLGDAVSYAREMKLDHYGMLTGAVGLVFVGGCLLGTVFYVPFLWSRKSLLAGGVLITIIVVLLCNMKSMGDIPLRVSDGIRWSLVIQFTLLFIVGLNILAIAVLDLWEKRDAISTMLFLWVFGTFVFATFINWSINGRTILPMVPAACILVMRRMETREKLASIRRWFLAGCALIPALTLATAVAWADYTLANAGRSAAAVIEQKYNDPTRQIWFQGHWGFQYYMERFGAKPIDFRHFTRVPGDVVVVPMNNTNLREGNPEVFQTVETFAIQPWKWLSVMQKMMGAGFYSDDFGCIPFLFGDAPLERYEVWLIKI